MSDFVQQHYVICNFSTSDSWVVLSPIEQSIRKKIEAVGTPLKDWDINIYRGVLTGCNEAFIIDTTKRDEILANCQSDEEREKTAELIRPFGRPSTTPSAFFLANASFVRWLIRLRSISAESPKAKARTLLWMSSPRR